ITSSKSNDDLVLLILDPAPSSTQYIKTFPQLGINKTPFAMSLTDCVTRSDPTTKIIIDNAHYIPAMVNPPGLRLSLSVGRIFAIILAIYLRVSNQLYTGFLDATRPYLLVIALFTAWGFYGPMQIRYAKA